MGEKGLEHAIESCERTVDFVLTFSNGGSKMQIDYIPIRPGISLNESLSLNAKPCYESRLRIKPPIKQHQKHTGSPQINANDFVRKEKK